MDARRGLSIAEGRPAIGEPPAWWSGCPRHGGPIVRPRPQVTATVGGKPPSGLGKDALLDFQMDVNARRRTADRPEIEQLLAHVGRPALVRGRWVEVDRERLSRMMERFRAVERRPRTDGLTFGEAMRLLAGCRRAGRQRRRPVTGLDRMSLPDPGWRRR